jgi:hypothetical protein
MVGTSFNLCTFTKLLSLDIKFPAGWLGAEMTPSECRINNQIIRQTNTALQEAQTDTYSPLPLAQAGFGVYMHVNIASVRQGQRSNNKKSAKKILRFVPLGIVGSHTV